MTLIQGLKAGTTGTVIPLSVDANGRLVIAGYDAVEEATVVKSMQKKFRDSFGGSSINAAKWDTSISAGMTATVSGGTLSFSSGTTANEESWILSKDTFTIPMRCSFALTLSQRIANQEFWVEFVSVDQSTGLPDGQNELAWLFDGASAVSGKYVVQNSGVTPLISGGSTINTTLSNGIYELEAFPDESWFHSGVLDSPNARTSSYRRHQQSPDPNASYKLRLRWKNGSTAPASSTTAVIQYVCVTDYTELTAEITAGRGQSSAGQGMAVTVAGGTVNVVESTLAVPSTSQTNSAASTNSTLVKNTAAVVYSLMATNTGASAAYVKLYNKATAPTVGTDVPIQTIVVPASSAVQIELGRVGVRLSTGLGFAITGAIAVADSTAVAAGQVQLTISYI